MKGRITLRIRRRVITKSNKYVDRWENLDQLTLDSTQKFYYAVNSKHFGSVGHIGKDELAFVRLLYMRHGQGDYNIQIFGKGKWRGFRRFWDGVITPDKKFIRRKQIPYTRLDVGSFESQSPYENTESFIGRFMKTKRPGIWYTL